MRAASFTSITCSTGSSVASAISSSVGSRPSSVASCLRGARDLALALADVHGDPDRPRLVRDPALDRLADPERRVRRELVALAPVELLAGADQPEDALLDQVEQRQLLPLVLLRDRDDQAQVRVDEPLLRLEVAALDRLGDLDLLVGGQQRMPADLVEEELQGVGGLAGDVAVRDLRLLRHRCGRSRPRPPSRAPRSARGRRRSAPRPARGPGSPRSARRGSRSPGPRPSRSGHRCDLSGRRPRLSTTPYRQGQKLKGTDLAHSPLV